jgi:hypothetical protein
MGSTAGIKIHDVLKYFLSLIGSEGTGLERGGERQLKVPVASGSGSGAMTGSRQGCFAKHTGLFFSKLNRKE